MIEKNILDTSEPETKTYYPPPESKGGWRYLIDPEDVRSVAGMDSGKLDQIRETELILHGGHSWGIAIIRYGFLVREYYTFNVLVPTRFDIWSGTKSFTGTAWGLLLDDSCQTKLPDGKKVALDSPAYSYIPAGYPLTDSRKEDITIRHLLTMTSGIPGSNGLVYGIPTATEHGPFEHALGRCPNRYGKWVDKLIAAPGTVWDYSDPAFAHLAMAFANIMGQEVSEVLKERIFDPIGIEDLSWDVQGGSGHIGPHSNAHTGVHISARELARFGYLMLYDGVWNARQLISKWWIELATKTSQDLNPAYGYTWWTNSKKALWPNLTEDAYLLSGYRSNYCCVIPSLDLVVARVGTGPTVPEGHFMQLIPNIVSAIIPDAGPDISKDRNG